ncbi:T9SS type A sorting domain-containing protein [Flavobacterium silvisoli]|uniref:T9SS type A sorting domain-containing protein n=1 Tax=Flavobacterium silvisoli TaxID=2529433 RepID=A0A4V2L4B5_9FLAO|nr:T9SS type A sorting domain-containing protein [Flavobacterium silvisoli]TBX66116.1 T9SS type A sorting domain-containing protein [Flavobacterium silvisoli]
MTVEDLVVQSNGKISAVGWSDFPTMSYSNDNWACRINSNGTMDTTFSTDGVNKFNGSFNGNDRAFSMILKSDNTIVVGGSSDVSAQSYAYAMFEIAPSGVLGSTSNQISIPFNALDKSYPYGLAEDINGKYVLVGSTGSTTNRTFSLARVNANYTIDTSFDTDGKVTTTFGANALNEAFDMVIQPDNKIIAVGYTGNDFAIARYLGTDNLSVNEFENQKLISIYPNPTKNTLNVDLINKNLTNSKYQILDLNGRIILEDNLNNDTNRINVESLSNGLYIFKIENLSAKFVKE